MYLMLTLHILLINRLYSMLSSSTSLSLFSFPRILFLVFSERLVSVEVRESFIDFIFYLDYISACSVKHFGMHFLNV